MSTTHAMDAAATPIANKDKYCDQQQHDKKDSSAEGCYQLPINDNGQDGAVTAAAAATPKAQGHSQDIFRTPQQHHDDNNNEQQHHHLHHHTPQQHRQAEEFDDEGNTTRVANLVFIEGILGQGAFGTVRLARRKLHTHHHHHHNLHSSSSGGGGENSNSGSNSANSSVSCAAAMSHHGGRRPRRRFLDKSVSEPRKKSSFFSEKSDYEMQQGAVKATPQQSQTPPDSAATDSKPAAAAAESPAKPKSCVTFSTQQSTRSLSPKPKDTSSPKSTRSQPPFLKHRTASTPVGLRHRGKRYQHHHHHGGKSSSVVGNLGLFTRSRSSLNNYDEYGYDDEEQLVAVKIFSKSILKRKRTMERDKSTKRVKVKTAWQQVEREIALMKKLSHPNLVQMFEVIDSVESDMLYMVLEYMPGGEILTYQNDGTFRRKNPRPAASDARYKQIEGIVDGHFDEEHAALYFVDILHGLGYLHLHHVCHRDLKPENILLDAKGVAKVGDFGVSHIFEKESDFGAQRMASIDEHQRLKEKDSDQDKSLGDSWSVEESSASVEDVPEHERRQPKLKRKDTDAALSMRGMAGSGMLSKTEGTWCFWSPEMCEGSQAFSGYAADMWAAGVCLYIFVTGKLPFYSEVPHELFETIASAEVSYAGLGLSNSLVDLLKRCLEKDPSKRAGVGDCLQHPFLQLARERRIRQLSEEFEISKKRTIVISDEDIKSAFRAVTSVPVQVLRSAGKKIQEGLAHTRDRFSLSTSSVSGEGESIVKHFQEGIHHLRTRLPSMGSTVHSGDEDSASGDNKHPKTSTDQPSLQYPSSPSQTRQRAIFFRRGLSDDSDVSLNTFDGGSPVASEKFIDTEMPSPRISRLSSMKSTSNLTDEMPSALLEADNEEETDRDEDDAGAPTDFQSLKAATFETKTASQDSTALGHRHESPLGAFDRSKTSTDVPLDWRNKKKKRRKEGGSKCLIQ